MACYRNALSVDERHYSSTARYGLIYFRQEKYDLSEYHFVRHYRSTHKALYCIVTWVWQNMPMESHQMLWRRWQVHFVSIHAIHKLDTNEQRYGCL